MAFHSNTFHRDPIFPELRSINLMALIPRVGSPKWSIIFLCMALLMSWPNFIMLFFIWILNAGNGGNGIKRHARGMLLGPSLLSEIYECFDTDTHYLGHLTKLKQSGTVEDFITTFEHLDFRTEGMTYSSSGNVLLVA
jgi:hypothetical protein